MINTISFERGPWGERGPGRARARAKMASILRPFSRARGSPRTPFTLRTLFKGNLLDYSIHQIYHIAFISIISYIVFVFLNGSLWKAFEHRHATLVPSSCLVLQHLSIGREELAANQTWGCSVLSLWQVVSIRSHKDKKVPFQVKSWPEYFRECDLSLYSFIKSVYIVL